MKEEEIGLLPVHSDHDSDTATHSSMPSDTRHDVPRHATGIARLTVHIPSAFKKNAPPPEERTPRERLAKMALRTVYFIVLVAALIPMVRYPMLLSQSWHHNYHLFAGRLTPGWIGGRWVDNTDPQYRSFRNNLPTLGKAAFIYLFVKFIRRTLQGPTNNQLYLISTNVVLSAIVVFALHGSSALKVLLIMGLNFLIPKFLKGSKFTPLVTWVFNGLVLFTAEIYHGFNWYDLHPSLDRLDGYTGAYPRWHVMFNITMLRLISFNMDYYWALTNPEPEPETKHLDDKQRTTTPHPLEFYSFANYFTYILYPPLYIAGPIITFNDFIWQHRRPLHTPTRQKLSYAVRFGICWLTMEWILHYIYVVAIKEKKAWKGEVASEIALIGFWNLIIVWLKLLIPWRFFRMWALFDNIDPPENMVRCMANNYSTFGFWRSWHRSYNLWIIRYIYIPLGGSRRQLLNLLIVFSFVALWHDLTFKLLMWGWLATLIVLPEAAATLLFPAKKYAHKPWYIPLCALGGAFNILLMMFANLIGFVIGPESITVFLKALFATGNGWKFLSAAVPALWVGVLIMFEYREEELRQGIVRRC